MFLNYFNWLIKNVLSILIHSTLCSFQLIVLLNLDFNCFNSFALPCVDKVTTGTSFVSVIVNVVAFVSSNNARFSDKKIIIKNCYYQHENI